MWYTLHPSLKRRLSWLRNRLSPSATSPSSSRLIRPERDDLSAAGARDFLKIDFEPSDHERMHELSLKAQDGAAYCRGAGRDRRLRTRRVLAGPNPLHGKAILEKASKKDRRLTSWTSNWSNEYGGARVPVVNTVGSQAPPRRFDLRSITSSRASTAAPPSPPTSPSRAFSATSTRDLTSPASIPNRGPSRRCFTRDATSGRPTSGGTVPYRSVARPSVAPRSPCCGSMHHSESPSDGR